MARRQDAPLHARIHTQPSVKGPTLNRCARKGSQGLAVCNGDRAACMHEAPPPPMLSDTCPHTRPSLQAATLSR